MSARVNDLRELLPLSSSRMYVSRWHPRERVERSSEIFKMVEPSPHDGHREQAEALKLRCTHGRGMIGSIGGARILLIDALSKGRSDEFNFSPSLSNGRWCGRQSNGWLSALSHAAKFVSAAYFLNETHVL